MRVMAKAKPLIDLDARIREKQQAAIAETPTITVRLFEKDWIVYADLNSFTALGFDAGDPSVVRDFIVNLIQEDQRDEFKRVVSEQRGVTIEVLMEILQGFVEAAAERPTKSPSASPATGSKRTSSRKPAASRASTVVRSSRI